MKRYNIVRKYEIVDIDTGEIFTKINNKDYITVATEKRYNNELTKSFFGEWKTIETTRRFVKHKGQTKLEI